MRLAADAPGLCQSWVRLLCGTVVSAAQEGVLDHADVVCSVFLCASARVTRAFAGGGSAPKS